VYARHTPHFPYNSMTNRLNIPALGFGLGLRPTHYPYIFEHKPKVDWFEIITENFMDTDGLPKRNLARIREHYPVVMHGVAMSIGTVDPINSEYMQKMKKLIDWLQPAWVSDHLCWTGVAHKNTHDLLPVPYTEEALKHIVGRIKQVQETLERPILLENPSTYLEYNDSTMPESEFITRMVEGSGCGLLLDVNNVYVSCFNHRLDPKAYIDAIPMENVGQIHLSGHTNNGTHIVDTHDDHVVDEVWALYRYVINKAGMKNTMIEWDDKIPKFEVLEAELEKARHAASTANEYGTLPTFVNTLPPRINNEPTPYAKQQQRMQRALLERNDYDSKPDAWIRPKPEFTPSEQLQVYINSYHWRLEDVVREDYPVLMHYLGEETFDNLVVEYVLKTPSTWFNASHYVSPFPTFVAKRLPEDIFAQEMAILETALALVFHEEETEALQQSHIDGLTPDALMAAKLALRKASRLFAFTYPVNQYFLQVMNEESPKKPGCGESYVAVFRHEDIVWRLDLEQAEYELLKLLESDRNVGEALEEISGMNILPDDQLIGSLQMWFARWMRNGLLANFQQGQHKEAA
jgi:uncharacterized protein (UPF0276 family)